jgi:hypothetical protein
MAKRKRRVNLGADSRSHLDAAQARLAVCGALHIKGQDAQNAGRCAEALDFFARAERQLGSAHAHLQSASDDEPREAGSRKKILEASLGVSRRALAADFNGRFVKLCVRKKG